ncbi:hypothetical protein, conserved [Leishmania tarentolae]|uniref:Uncharacterized protein n=1 Tax=Leishmania tarentolae TaxID=5689 RepID=A0A640KCC3_LEITA|nr:hypothetical protein, conserved [Leishmania tarentolae]
MPGVVPPKAAVEAIRLEPLRFGGYERLDKGSDEFVRLVTPQGGCVRLHLSFPSHLGSSPQLQELPRLDHLPAPLPPRPLDGESTQKVAAPAAALADARRAREDATGSQMPSAPPEGFEVEFLSSSSGESSMVSSSATSRGASPPPEAAATENIDKDHAPADTSDAGDGKPIVLSDTAGELEGVAAEEKHVLHRFVHGTELKASAASLAELDNELTRHALLLFDGRLPQQSQAPGQVEASRQWSEAVNYHRVVLLGYDDAGFAYMDAQAFAQRVPPPQGWRLCPLPLLVCAVERVAHFFRCAESEGPNGHRNYAGASDAVLGHPVMPRATATAADGGSGTRANAQSERSGSTGATLPSPSSLASVPGEPLPFTSSAKTPPAPPSSSLAYMRPPLRWSLPVCGDAPSLDLQQLFQVQPNRVYQLTRPPEEVVFVGVALGIPWVRSVVLDNIPVPDAGSPQVETRHGAVLHSSYSSIALPGSQPPAGYRWKNTSLWAEPLIGCHDACDIRGRHGLVDPSPVATGVSPAVAVVDPEGSAPPSALPSAVAGAPDEELRQEIALQPSGDDEKKSSTSAPLVLPPSPKPLTGAAPLFVKEGTRVFVPGRFGVMLECNIESALMEAHFGVVHGDQLVPRSLSSHVVAAPLSSTPNRGKTTTPSQPPGPFIVMGLHGRNVLVLLADGEGQTAVQIHVTRGVEQVAETFRKVAGTPLSPPALPLEPLSMPASPPGSTVVTETAAPPHLVAKGQDSQGQPQALEAEQREVQAGFAPNAVTGIAAEGTDAVIVLAADTTTAAEAPLSMCRTVGMQGVEAVGEQGGHATLVADGECNGRRTPAEEVMLTDPHKAGKNAMPASSSVAAEVSKRTSMLLTSAPCGARWSSTRSYSASATSFDSQASQQRQPEQQGQLEQMGEEKACRSGPSTARAGAPSTPAEKVVAEAAEGWPTPVPQWLDPVEEVMAVPPLTAAIDHVPLLRTTSATDHAITPQSSERVSEAKAAGAFVEAEKAKIGGEEGVLHQNDEGVSADVTRQGYSLLRLPEKDLTAAEGKLGKYPQQESGFSAPFLSSHTPSGHLTPSSSMQQPSQRQCMPDAQETSLDTEVNFSEDSAGVHCLHTARETELEEREQHASGADADHVGGAVSMFCAPSSLAPMAQQRCLHERTPLHVAIPRSEDVVVKTAMAHSAVTSTPSFLPPPANPADHRAEPEVGDAKAPSYFTSGTSSCAVAVGRQHYSTATPFINFLKAYAIYVLGTHGAVSGGESKQLCNGIASHMDECAEGAGETPRIVGGLVPILDFYREQPLARIMEATTTQRRCRAAWDAAIASTPASAALQNMSDVQVCKLKASASTTVFTELCVEELVSLLSVVHHPSSRQGG